MLPNTPNELVELNTKDIPLAIPVKTISKGINGKDDNHSITKENMIKLFDGVTNAVAIINYKAKNSFMIVTDILQNGKPIVITFAKDSEFDGDNVHKATSIHIREDLRAHLEYLENAEIIIKNKNKLNSFTGNSDILARLHKTVKLIDVSISGSSEKSKGKVQKSAAEIYLEYDKPITADDVRILRSIIEAHNGQRVSINDFTSEDIQKAQKWAYKFYKELGVKSTFFRAWFGDWRAHSIDPVELVSFAYGESPKINYNKRTVINADMSKEIIVDDDIVSDSIHYAKINGDEKHIKKLLGKVNEIIEKGVLLDTQLSSDKKNNKKGSTQFMHYLYTPV